MSKEFINDLYYGRISPWERKRTRKAAVLELDNQIACKRKEFTERLVTEDLQCFEVLEDLYLTRQELEVVESFRQGLRLGARFMEEICSRELSEELT